jgi:hypothetical protein
MKILNLRLQNGEKTTRIAATVQWEDIDRPSQEIFIETEKEFSGDISCNPDAFIVGCLVPALHFGEKRIFLDAETDPMLQEGLYAVMAVLREWSGGVYKPLKIEAKTNRIARYGQKQRVAGMFLSGGIDSLAALRTNMLHYPKDHPGSIKDCLIIHGFDIGGVVERGMKYHVFDRAKAAMSVVAKDANVRLIPVYTNIRHLCDERDLWLEKFFGAVLASVAHAFAARLNLVFVASSYDISNLVPCGSHPLLDPEYSSYELKIKLRDLELSRLDKLRLIANWDAAFQNLRVCLANVEDRLNCGKCEKCVRTMIGLVAIGALNKTRAFIEDDVTPELLSNFNIVIRHRASFYQEMLEPLKERGRDDLVKTIKKMLAG